MVKMVLFIGMILILLQACNSENRQGINKSSFKETPNFLNLNALFTDEERNVSFPLWFNDSMILSNHITKITRRFYLLDSDEYDQAWDLKAIIPREKREYIYSPEGWLKNLFIFYFYDNQQIGDLSYVYDGSVDDHGFVNVKQTGDTDFKWEAEEDNINFFFNIHKKVKSTTKYLAYQNEQTGDYLFYMTNKKFWGPLSIDSILHPTPKDIIVLGTPTHQTKKYRVKNKVNEMDVHLYEYSNKKDRLENIIRQEYPFEHKRTILYDKSGRCNGYIDSTFSESKYLTRIQTKIDYDPKGLPLKITHLKDNPQNNTSLISIELLTYE